jgi:NAD(P)-dependent dehydrogenase (short-subunit alcohol dehydrogenase family)
MGTIKRVFITGTSSGFGYGATRALAEKGHTVYATMRAPNGKNAAIAREISAWSAQNGYDVHLLDVDVTKESSIREAVSTVVDKGGIDVLINNAGVGTWGIDEGYTLNQAQRIFDINLFGVMRVNREVVPYMRSKHKGVIVYLSSGLGRIVLPFTAIYTASKFALEGYAESTSYELEPLGIHSVIIEPGAFGTNFMTNSLLPEKNVLSQYGSTATALAAFSKGFEERAQSGMMGKPDEVVQALVEEVERPMDAARPLRRTIGQDVKEGVGAINQTCEQVQQHLLKAFGLK